MLKSTKHTFILAMAVAVLSLFVQPAYAQNSVSGTVVDEKSEPVIGASIVVKGDASSYAVTDTDGKFTISAEKGETLEVTFMGYLTQNIQVGSSAVINITMQPDYSSLEEVMVVAYGTAKKSSFTGSASVVKSEQIQKISGSGFVETLQGMSAGVQVVNSEGNPGADSRIQIRGLASMSGKTTPLYIVDGMPYDGTLTSINPSDIESMTVLKDAAASSLYGSRAANGVVVITTKKGKEGKTTVNFRAAWGTSDLAVPFMTKADPYQQLYVDWKSVYNDQVYLHGKSPQEAGDYASAHAMSRSVNPVVNSQGETVYVTPFKWPGDVSNFVLHDGNGNAWVNPDLELIWDESDYDWNQQIFSRKLRQDYGVDVSGSSKSGKTTYFASMGYLDDNGYANDDFYKRYSFRANVESQITKWFSMGGSLSYSYSRKYARGYNRALGFHTSLTSPYLRNADNTEWIVSEKTGLKVYDYATNNGHYFGAHPLGRGNYWNNYNDEDCGGTEVSTISAKYFLNFVLPYGFNFRSSVNLDDNNTNSYGYGSAVWGEDQVAPYGMTVKTNGGSASRSNGKVMSVTWNNLLTWNKSYGDHNISALAGQEFYNYNYQSSSCSGEGIMSIGQYEVASTTKNWSASSNRTRYALLSFFGKADYNYANRYYVSGSLRGDGSSRFSESSRWGLFWSAGASWRISNENFLRNVKWINNLVLRASYGTTGNDKLISRATNGNAGSEVYYAYQEYYTSDNLYETAGYQPSTFATPDLRWEKNKQFNVGLDFSFLNSRLGGTIEYYNRGSEDLLYYKNLPLSSQVGGATGYNTNLGNIVNRGFELTINAVPIQKKNFLWAIDFNVSTLENEVTYLPGGSYIYSQSNSGIHYKLEEGKSIFEFYEVKNAGVDPETGLMQYWIQDGNGGWKTTTNYSDVTTEDYQWCGTAIPKAFGSITNSFQIFDFDLSFMLYGSFGAKLQNYMYFESATNRNGVGLMWDVVEGKVWENPGDEAYYPRWSYEKDSNNRKPSDFFIFNNDYLRLRNVTIGYTLPSKVLKKMKMEKLRFYITGDNLMTWGTAASLHSDPETGVLGYNYNGNIESGGLMSARRVYMGGVQITF